MAFIEMTREGDAEGAAAELFEADQARLGYVTSLTQLFALRPSVFAAWRNLICSITENLSSRRYELATIAAARQLRSSYCMLAQPTLLCDESECPRPSPLSLRRSVVASSCAYSRHVVPRARALSPRSRVRRARPVRRGGARRSWSASPGRA